MSPRHTIGLTLILLGSATLQGAEREPVVWTFQDDAVGSIPRGFHEEVGRWRVAKADGHKALAQKGESPDKVFNVILATKHHPVNVELSVRMQAVSGKLDQGGGLIWRARDKNNYYLARYNPLEDNFRVFKVEHGKRTMFKNADIIHKPGWHTLRVTMEGKHIECFYDGKKYLECDDATFPDGGMIGLWTKADAQSDFADLELRVTSP
jgi:hypothetical protein